MQIFQCKAHPEYSIVAYSYENQHNWGHKAELIHNHTNTLAKNKIVYYNRTWESYQYQSVIKSLLNTYITYLIDEYIADYKYSHSIKRLKSNLKQELTLLAKQSDTISKLEEFYNEL